MKQEDVEKLVALCRKNLEEAEAERLALMKVWETYGKSLNMEAEIQRLDLEIRCLQRMLDMAEDLKSVEQ